MPAPTSTNMHRMHIFIPPVTKKRIIKLAKQQGIPLSEFVRRAVQEYVDKQTT